MREEVANPVNPFLSAGRGLKVLGCPSYVGIRFQAMNKDDASDIR